MNARSRIAKKAKPALFVLLAIVLIEIVASTIFAVAAFLLITLDGGLPVEPILGLAEMVVGINTFVLAAGVLTYSPVDPVLIGATAVAYLIGAVLVVVVARAVDRRYDLVDGDSPFGVIER